ncbi:GNAT family N-acetyltransferase [Paraliobacillus ryukyuensis]|uniref:GNAT family N-acetyltransferase n=1 Tax=Paraliobacillus ryukyuensis TaxID=200904 RepID=UPI0009A5C036|nr:GNAT family N-acetyltransferase [Paraliobacillus ryukyuensis]
MELNAPRIQFRPYTDDDFDYLFSMLSDPKMMRYIGDGQTKHRAGTMQFLKWIYHTYHTGTDLGLMLLEEKESHQPIGHAGLVPQTIDGVNEIEIGYWISRAHWGMGYATEAASALLDYGRTRMENERFIALIQPGNVASRKVAGKLGMTLDKEIVLKNQLVHVYVI